MNKQPIENFDATLLLFVISFAPSFIIPNFFTATSVMKDHPHSIVWVLIGISFIAFLFNWITLSLLNTIAPDMRQYSYQEVAYMISKGNRGYIFLISAAKFFLLSMSTAFALDYIACTIANLIVFNNYKLESSVIWSIYLAALFITSLAMFIIYQFINRKKNMADLKIWGYIFTVFALIQWLAVIVISTIAAIGYDDNKDRD